MANPGAANLLKHAEAKGYGYRRTILLLTEYNYACPICMKLLAAGASCPSKNKLSHTIGGI